MPKFEPDNNILFAYFGLYERQLVAVNRGIFGSMTNFKVKKDVSVTWADCMQEGFDLTLKQGIDSWNIEEQKAGTVFGWCNGKELFCVESNKGIISESLFFERSGGQLILKKAFVPNLLSCKENIIKESGFYLFERKKD